MRTALSKSSRAWRKARIAARILLRKRHGKPTARDRNLAHSLAKDPGVTNRLIDQAIHSLHAKRKARA